MNRVTLRERLAETERKWLALLFACVLWFGVCNFGVSNWNHARLTTYKEGLATNALWNNVADPSLDTKTADSILAQAIRIYLQEVKRLEKLAEKLAKESPEVSVNFPSFSHSTHDISPGIWDLYFYSPNRHRGVQFLTDKGGYDLRQFKQSGLKGLIKSATYRHLPHWQYVWIWWRPILLIVVAVSLATIWPLVIQWRKLRSHPHRKLIRQIHGRILLLQEEKSRLDRESQSAVIKKVDQALALLGQKLVDLDREPQMTVEHRRQVEQSCEEERAEGLIRLAQETADEAGAVLKARADV